MQFWFLMDTDEKALNGHKVLGLFTDLDRAKAAKTKYTQWASGPWVVNETEPGPWRSTPVILD